MANPLPSNNAQYLENDYWNTRFEAEQQYDWFKDYSQFKHLLTPHIQPSNSILILGCGNSSLTQDLYEDGYKDLTSIDLSPVVINNMQATAAAVSQCDIKWQVADMLDLPFADHTFDVVIEKGTMDVLFVDNDQPFDARAEVKKRVFQMLHETHRVLKSDGLFVSVTFAQPHFRKPFLLSQEFSWNISVSTFGEGFHYYVYTLQKGRRTETDHPVPFGWPTRDPAAPSGFADSTMQHDHMDHADYLLSIDL